jgi:elongation factor Ts
MTEISAQQVKALREATGAGMMDCKNALAEVDGDLDKAIEILRKKGLAGVEKRAGRTANQGRVDSYIHFNNTVGVLVEINCETDFVANTDEFKTLVKDIALHIASPSAPRYLSRDDVPQAEIDRVNAIFEVQAKESGKPDPVVAKIVEGKLNAHLKDLALLEQPYVKDDSKTVQQLLDEVAAQLKEKIAVRRFARFKLGEALEDEQDGPPAES